MTRRWGNKTSTSGDGYMRGEEERPCRGCTRVEQDRAVVIGRERQTGALGYTGKSLDGEADSERTPVGGKQVYPDTALSLFPTALTCVTASPSRSEEEIGGRCAWN
jgi:hypothetical protein